MIKFAIHNRWSGAVQFEAEIEASEDTLPSVKIGLAVKWAVRADANLADANLADAKWRDGIVITKAPIQIFGLPYRVTILDRHMQIGCELHSLAEWDAFDDRRIAAMDGTKASHFWRDHKAGLLAVARGAGRSTEPPTEADRPAVAAE